METNHVALYRAKLAVCCDIVNLLTYSMVPSPSWEANWFAASQEIPHISWNPKVHYRTHKRPPPVPILGQPNPVHIPASHLLEIHPNIIHPSTPRRHSQHRINTLCGQNVKLLNVKTGGTYSNKWALKGLCLCDCNMYSLLQCPYIYISTYFQGDVLAFWSNEQLLFSQKLIDLVNLLFIVILPFIW